MLHYEFNEWLKVVTKETEDAIYVHKILSDNVVVFGNKEFGVDIDFVMQVCTAFYNAAKFNDTERLMAVAGQLAWLSIHNDWEFDVLHIHNELMEWFSED